MSTYAFMQGYLGNGDSSTSDAGQTAASEAIKQPEHQEVTSAAENDDKSPSSAADLDSQEFAAPTVQKPETMRRRSKKNKKRSKLTMENFLRLANLLFI